MVGIQPSEFWNMSPTEVYATLAGFKEFNTSDDDSQKPLDRESLEQLMELYPD
jgi:hypothetical protein